MALKVVTSVFLTAVISNLPRRFEGSQLGVARSQDPLMQRRGLGNSDLGEIARSQGHS